MALLGLEDLVHNGNTLVMNHELALADKDSTVDPGVFGVGGSLNDRSSQKVPVIKLGRLGAGVASENLAHCGCHFEMARVLNVERLILARDSMNPDIEFAEAIFDDGPVSTVG